MSSHLDKAIDRAIEMCARLMLALMKYRRGGAKGHAEVLQNLDDVDIAVGNLNLSVLHHLAPDDKLSK